MNTEFRKIIIWLIPVVLIVSFAFFIHGRVVNFTDVDSFYHIRHAWLYQTNGIFQTSFPWVQYSVINLYAADIWYGFHILILPLTYLKDLALGIKIGALLTTMLASGLFLLALLKLKIKWPILWLTIFLLASADLLYRLTMLRPHPFSLGLSVLLFAYLATRETARSKFLIFLISAAISWIHLSLSWVPVLIIAIISTAEFMHQQDVTIRKYIAAGLGLLTGLLLRPNPLGAARLAYIQVVKLLFEKQSELPIRFGRELLPFVWENFVDQLIPITTLTLMGVGFILWLVWQKRWKSMSPELKSPVIASLALAGVFFLLTFGVARRSNEIFVAFAVLFVGLMFTHVKSLIIKLDWYHYALMIITFVVLAYMPFKTMYRFDSYQATTFSVNRYKEVAQWLNQNTEPEEIVFNIHWDRFAQLFFWNQHNYFINGMDPIFEYAYNPALYWKTHFLAIDAGTAYTCGQVRCTAEEVVPTPGVLKKDFNASYILVEKQRNPKVFDYLSNAPEFQRAFETDYDAVFRIL